MNPPLSITQIVEKHSWKSILLNLIYEGKIDPWDIDIDVVVEEFMNRIREMKELDLYIPGNLILASSILLKYKSLYLMVEEKEEEETLDLDVGEVELKVVKRIKPNRPITLNELVEVIEETINININEAQKKRSYSKPPIIQKDLFVYKKEDIESVIKDLLLKLKELMDEYGLVRLSEIIKGKEKERAVVEFLAILHMENENYLTLKQEKAFEEVLIYMNKERLSS